MAASIADNETWHVMIADDMKRMNVEQLDDAFRLSLVDASTMVWKAGMKSWQSLGAVAGLEDEEPEDSVTRMVAHVPPPPPRATARPVPKPPSPRSIPPAPRPPSARPAVNPFLATAPAFPPPPAYVPPPSYAPPPPPAPRPVAAPVYAQPLVAPVAMYTPPVVASIPPISMPPRRSAMPSEVDFRRKSGGVRWGRWLMVAVLLSSAVLVSYRQNWLREGARRVGLENKYLYGERRVTAFVTAKAPFAVKNALGKMALLPGPNAETGAVAPPRPAPQPVAAAPATPVVAPTPTETASPPTATKPLESDVKTVSLDSLPVLGEAAAPTKPEPPVVAKASPHVTHRTVAKAEPKPKAEAKAKVEAKPKAEPKPKAAPTPVANDNPLKAAIRSAIAADAAK